MKKPSLRKVLRTINNYVVFFLLVAFAILGRCDERSTTRCNQFITALTIWVICSSGKNQYISMIAIGNSGSNYGTTFISRFGHDDTITQSGNNAIACEEVPSMDIVGRCVIGNKHPVLFNHFSRNIAMSCRVYGV